MAKADDSDLAEVTQFLCRFCIQQKFMFAVRSMGIEFTSHISNQTLLTLASLSEEIAR